MKIQSSDIQLVNINELIPYSKNMNKHSPEQIERLIKLIEYQGFRDPIIAQKGTNIIAAGHGRWEAAKKMGVKQVPVTYQEFENEAQFYAFVVSHNAIAKDSWAELDLSAVNTEMLNLGADFDLDLLGIKDFEIAPIEEFEPQGDEDAVPEVEHPISTKGDIWILGRHRLMCGDSVMVDDVEKLMAGQKAEMVFTDPPYLMNFTGAVNADGSKSHSAIHGAIKNDKMSREDGDKFIGDVVANIRQFCTGAFYICFYRLGMDYIFRALDLHDLQCRAVIVWYKAGGTLSNSDYKSNYEPIFYGWVKDHNFHGGKAEWDFWDVSKTKINDLHPTMKPVELCERAINNSSKKNQIVLDFFGGSGSTLIACEKIGRNAYLMELEEKYCDVIIKRWEQYTGKKATLEGTGQTYEELKSARM